MRHFYKIPFLVLLFTLSSCDSSKTSTQVSTKQVLITSEVQELSYEDVKDKMILYSNIFAIEKESYYVYFYSTTCSHCSSLKSFIIKEAIKRGDIYFVEASEQVVLLKDVEPTIGLTSIEEFGIIGYPSLVQIIDSTVVKNIAGVPVIKNELTN